MIKIWLVFAVLLNLLSPQFAHAEAPAVRQSTQEEDNKPHIYPQFALLSDSLAISPDGRLALTGSGNTFKLWEIASGREIRTFTGHTARVVSIVFTPDGQYALSGSNDGSWRLWDIATGNTIRTARAHMGSVHVAVSPDGREVLSGGFDEKVILWDLATGLALRTMTLPKVSTLLIPKQGFIQSIAFSPDGRHALLAQYYASLGIFGIKIHSDLEFWDVTTGQLLHTMDGHSGVISSVAISPDGRRALSGGHDKTLKLWDLNTGKKIRTMDHDSEVYSVAFSPDGKQALSSGLEGVKLWDLASGEERRTLGGNESLHDSRAAVFSPDGRQSLSMDSKGLQLFDIATGALIRRFRGTSILAWWAPTAFSPDMGCVVAGGPALGIWDVAAGRMLYALKGDAMGMTSIALSPDRRQLLSGHLDKTLRLRDANTGTLIRSFKGHSSPVNSIALSRDGKLALSSAGPYDPYGGDPSDEGDDSIRLWDISDGKTVRTLTEKYVVSVAMSPDGKHALSSGRLGVKLWNLNSGTPIRTLLRDPSQAVVFSPDGRYALSGSSPIKLFDVGTGQEIRSFQGNSGYVLALAYSPDGTRALSGSGYGTMMLWDVATGKEIRTFEGHTGPVSAVAFSADGRLAFSGSMDSSTRAWDVTTGREVVQMVGFEDGEWIAITPDGYYDASPNGDKYLNVRIGNKLYGIENYREAFFRPDLVKMALSGGSLKGYRNIAEVKTPPQVEIVNTPLSVAGDELTVQLKLSDTGGGIGDVRLYLNGSAVMTDNTRGVKLVAKENRQGATRSYKLRLTRGENILRAVAFNADNSMQSNNTEQTVTATFTPAARPTLHAVVIGINEYRNPKLRLQYAVPDAGLFTETLKSGATDLFGKVNVVLLTTPAQTTSENIASELKKMRSINPDDMFMLFVAGHGTVDDGEYFLITSNVGSTSTAKLKTDALSQNRIKELIANIPATKKVIMLDTCNAGQMGDAIQVALMTRGMSEDTAFKILSRAVGSTILSSATSTQEALEGYRGHGLFTWVLAEGMKGKADRGKSGYIKTTDLVDYVESEVPEIAEREFKRKQYPTTAVSGQGFPIGKTGP